MAQIKTQLDKYPFEKIEIKVPEQELDLTAANGIAKEKARALNPNAMMLSFHSRKTGEFWPKYDCGSGGRSPWIVFAESRGYNLLIDINDGEFEFFYLRM